MDNWIKYLQYIIAGVIVFSAITFLYFKLQTNQFNKDTLSQESKSEFLGRAIDSTEKATAQIIPNRPITNSETFSSNAFKDSLEAERLRTLNDLKALYTQQLRFYSKMTMAANSFKFALIILFALYLFVSLRKRLITR